MPAKRIDLTGKVFGKLTVFGYSHSNKYAYWKCLCECGKESIVRSSHLLTGAIKTCGCSWSENGKKTIKVALEAHKKYGEYANSRLYTIWKSMKERCSDKKNKDYGGRGITICSEWANNFLAFYNWAMANGYSDDLSIDRMDNDGNYCPENCRWSDKTTQANNTRKNVYITYCGETKSMAQWAKEFDIPVSTFCRWIKNGKNIEEIILKKCGNNKGKMVS
jgi:hypothetical protein